MARKIFWGERWVLGGILMILETQMKKKGRRRTESSCKGFRNFIEDMEMKEGGFQEKLLHWANNWEDEGYIEVL